MHRYIAAPMAWTIAVVVYIALYGKRWQQIAYLGAWIACGILAPLLCFVLAAWLGICFATLAIRKGSI
jgi:hypothetical protein